MPCQSKNGTSQTGSPDSLIMLRTPKLQDISGFGVGYSLSAAHFSDGSGFHMAYKLSTPISISLSSRLQVAVREGQWACLEICYRTLTTTLVRTRYQSVGSLDISARYPVKLTLTTKENLGLKHHSLLFQKNSPVSSLSIRRS